MKDTPSNGSNAQSEAAHHGTNNHPIGQIPILDPNMFAINQDFKIHLQTRKKPTTVMVRKPDSQTWIYFHPDPAWRAVVGLLEDKANQIAYVVDRNLVPDVLQDMKPKLLATYATHAGTLGLCPIGMPDEHGKHEPHAASLTEIVNVYAGHWIRITHNNENRSYDVTDSPTAPGAPKWPLEGFQYIFDLAFRGRVIRDPNHDFLRRLRECV
jgi:hypothetical protein